MYICGKIINKYSAQKFYYSLKTKQKFTAIIKTKRENVDKRLAFIFIIIYQVKEFLKQSSLILSKILLNRGFSIILIYFLFYIFFWMYLIVLLKKYNREYTS